MKNAFKYLLVYLCINRVRYVYLMLMFFVGYAKISQQKQVCGARAINFNEVYISIAY